jgi:hypothetical protein
MFDDPEPRGSGIDHLARADFLRDYYRDHFACRTCGSPDPAIIEGAYCSDCKGENRQRFEATRAARLAREAAAARLADMADVDPEEDDFNIEGQPEFNGSFR